MNIFLIFFAGLLVAASALPTQHQQPHQNQVSRGHGSREEPISNELGSSHESSEDDEEETSHGSTTPAEDEGQGHTQRNPGLPHITLFLTPPRREEGYVQPPPVYFLAPVADAPSVYQYHHTTDTESAESEEMETPTTQGAAQGHQAGMQEITQGQGTQRQGRGQGETGHRE